MLLMDCIAATAAMIPPGRMNPVLQVFPDLVERMQSAPRYLLDRNAIEASIELGLGRPTILRAALEHVRVPYQRMWCEWQESDRSALRDKIGEQFKDPVRPLPVRLGFLIEADRGGRRGEITWAWTSPASDTIPNIAPIAAYFDLDADIPQSAERIEAFKRSNLAAL